MSNRRLKSITTENAASTSDTTDETFDGEEAYVPSRHKKPMPHPTRGGEVSCLRCGALFQSWDRTRNRLCPACSNRKW